MLYQFTDPDRLQKLKKALLPLGFRLRIVKPEEYLQPLGYLAGVKGIEPNGEPCDAEPLEKEMLFMAGFTSGRVDALIKALRKTGVGRVDYKAVLTPVNQTWNSLELYREIAREHETMTGGENGQ